MRLPAAVVALSSLATFAATKDLRPGESFEAAVGSLQPGDTLVVHAGTYAQTSRVSITVKGTAALPVLITAAPNEARPLVTRTASVSVQNTVNIEGASYLTVRGLEVSSNGGDGVNLNSTPDHVTLEDLDIHDVDVGVNFRSNMDHITVRRCHIHRTGAGGGGTGEGMYVGCNNGSCVVRDSVLEGNWVHDTRASTQGDGIEVKQGSHSNVLRDNVIHDTRYPCITMYGTLGNPVNVVERNVTWSCDDSAIQVGADIVVRNNLFIENSGQGFAGNPIQGDVAGNVTVVHNTIVGGTTCVRMNGWNNRQGLVFANNAVYCPSGNFVAAAGVAGVSFAGNVFAPVTAVFPAGTAGVSAAMDFVDAAARDFAPKAGSPLRGAASATYAVAEDFEGRPRAGTAISGAVIASGWRPVAGFKPTAASGADAGVGGGAGGGSGGGGGSAGSTGGGSAGGGGSTGGGSAGGGSAGTGGGSAGGGSTGGGNVDGGSGPTGTGSCGCSAMDGLMPLALLLITARRRLQATALR